MAPRFENLARWCTLGVGVLGLCVEVPPWLEDLADPSTCSATHLLQATAGARRMGRSGVGAPTTFDLYKHVAPDDIVASMASQVSCSLLHLAGRDEAQFQRTEFKLYALQATAESHGEDPVVVSASFNHNSTSYAYHGKYFGCQRVEHLEGLGSTHETLSRASDSIGDMMASTAVRSDTASHLSASPAVEMPQAVLDFVETATNDPTMYAVLVSYKGNLVEHYRTQEGFSKDSLLHGWSMAKSILSLLLGARSAEGKLDISSFVTTSEITQEEKLRRNMTIASLLSMRVGEPLEEALGTPPDLWQASSSAAYAIDGGPKAKMQPGEFRYASGNSNINSRELRRTFEDGEAGLQEYLQYPWAALFSRIGATSFACELDPAFTFVFSSFCYGTARDYMKLAELVLSRGSWAGEQVVPAEWIDWTTSIVPGGDPEYSRGWWRLDQRYPRAQLGTPVISASGTMGQYSMAIPEHDLVITRLGSNEPTTSWFGPAAESPLHKLLTSLREES